MIEKICKELGLKYNGKWEGEEVYLFTIINPESVAYEATFAVPNLNKALLIAKVNDVETKFG